MLARQLALGYLSITLATFLKLGCLYAQHWTFVGAHVILFPFKDHEWGQCAGSGEVLVNRQVDTRRIRSPAALWTEITKFVYFLLMLRVPAQGFYRRYFRDHLQRRGAPTKNPLYFYVST